MTCGCGRSKSRLAKAAGAKPSGQMRDEKVHAVVARSTFASEKGKNTSHSDHFWKLRCRKSARRCGAKNISKSKLKKPGVRTTFGSWDVEKRCGAKHISKSKCNMHKTPQLRTTFGRWGVEKVHAVVARSTFPSQNEKNKGFGPLLEVEMSKNVVARNTFRSQNVTCTKHLSFGPLLEVEMSKKCTSLWREAHFEVKMLKTPGVRRTFGRWDVEKVHAVVARSTFRSQNVKKTRGSDHFWTFRCRFVWQAQGIVHLLKSEQKVKVL